MVIKMFLAILILFQAGLITLSQVDIIPDRLSAILQLLILIAFMGSFMWMTNHFMRWHTEQMRMLLETHEQRLNKVIEMIEKLTGQLAANTGQLAINTGAINETLRTGELIEEVKRLLVKVIP